jgi:hypothetical protein
LVHTTTQFAARDRRRVLALFLRCGWAILYLPGSNIDHQLGSLAEITGDACVWSWASGPLMQEKALKGNLPRR